MIKTKNSNQDNLCKIDEIHALLSVEHIKSTKIAYSLYGRRFTIGGQKIKISALVNHLHKVVANLNDIEKNDSKPKIKEIIRKLAILDYSENGSKAAKLYRLIAGFSPFRINRKSKIEKLYKLLNQPQNTPTENGRNFARLQSPLSIDFVARVSECLSPTDQCALGRTSKEHNKVFQKIQPRRRNATYRDLNDNHLRDLIKRSPNLTELNLLESRRLTQDGVALLSPLTRLTSLHLDTCENLTDSGVKSLKELPLRSLALSNCSQITDTGIKNITEFKNLQHLLLSQNKKLTGNCLHTLSTLSNLHSLTLNDWPHFTDDDLEKLVRYLPGITSLNLSGCRQLTDQGIAHLTLLTQLKSLNLSGCDKLSSTGLKHLSTLTHLEELNVSHCYNVTDECLQSLNALPLKRLYLNHCYKLTDNGLRHMACLPLETLDVSNCSQLTGKGIKELRGTPIRTLHLHGCYKLKNKDLQSLQFLLQLENVNVSHCYEISNSGLKHLQGLPLQVLNVSGCYRLTNKGLIQLLSLPLRTIIVNNCYRLSASKNYFFQKMHG